MGQDEIYLQVIATSGEGAERKNAKKVLKLLKRGKHWVLVTLLLGNVITNETLPIVLDRSLGGGWPAVLGSTVLIGKAPYSLVQTPDSDTAQSFENSCNQTNTSQSSLAKSLLNPSASAMACQLALL